MKKLQHLTTDDAFDVALLADHLGLSHLLEDAAIDLVQVPWWDQDDGIMHKLGVLLQIAPYKQDGGKRSDLLHHPKRGALTELQVLESLDRKGCHEDEILSTLQMEGLQSGELKVLLAAIASRPKERVSSYKQLFSSIWFLWPCDQILTGTSLFGLSVTLICHWVTKIIQPQLSL